MSDATKIAIPSTAAYVLHKAYQKGTLEDIKDLLFKNSHPDKVHTFPEAGGPSPKTTATNVPEPALALTIEPAGTIHGQPAENIVFDPNVYQYYNDTCAIRSQHLILQQFDIDVTQEEMIEIAKENGWYAEGYGTPMDMVGNLLSYYGINVKGSTGNNIFNLSNELAQGHQIIVGVDANELVHPEESVDVDSIYGEQANHALVVMGIDTTNPNNVQVIVTDPGTGARQMAYPAEQFMDAWKDSNCFMVSTTDIPTANPLHPYSPINSFAGIPTDTLDRLSGMNLNVEKDSLYADFMEDFMANPLDIDSLLTQYEDLFFYDPNESEYE